MYWLSLKRITGKDKSGKPYADGTIKRYMGAVWVQIKDKFMLSKYFPIIERLYTPAMKNLQKLLKEHQKQGPVMVKNKVYTQKDIEFILRSKKGFVVEYREVSALLCLSNSNTQLE